MSVPSGPYSVRLATSDRSEYCTAAFHAGFGTCSYPFPAVPSGSSRNPRRTRPISTTNEVMETTVLALGSAPPLSFVAWVLIGLTVGVLVVMLVAVSRRETPEDQTRRAYVTAAIAGLVGAVIGGWIITLFGVDAVGGGMYLSMLTAIIGAAVLSGGSTLVGKNRKGAVQVRS
ncbi:MAG TPA: hypothetical protein DCL06_03360 [Corynebacterium variabile]|uniref:Transglycosylase associated protein n=2 Tax=Corynebacterium variabile TaxID=1727 RepID=A0A3B9QSX6_9CORY|nr:hypothetical protein [Corynebacterium variabile]